MSARLRAAFTIVELLVVIGIIAVLMGILLPSLQQARETAKMVACASNMKQIGYAMLMYSNENRGQMFPSDAGGPTDFPPDDLQWYVFVLKVKPPIPVPADGSKWMPKALICPMDVDVPNWHSYMLNDHINARQIRYSSRVSGMSSSQLVLMGEKPFDCTDYYVQRVPTWDSDASDYEKCVDELHHGIRRGSNLLYMDVHVDALPPPKVTTPETVQTNAPQEDWPRVDKWDVQHGAPVELPFTIFHP